jgi:pseudouridine-5'-phosphate glycosidase
MPDPVLISERVAVALASRRPVVALESTLITHGLPAPTGVETARALEAIVREESAEPATIGVIDGSIRVGLEPDELERLAGADDVNKLSLSNLASHIVRGGPGSTTVAATLFVASRVGIQVFATGGIGGVHRGADRSGDVSADLMALSRWPVAVVCAGAKAILDLPRTREMLETLGVPVLGFGTDRFPAFYQRDSGLTVDARYDDTASLAAAIRTHWKIGLGSGVVVGNPIPAEHALPADEHEEALEAAIAEAERSGVTGRAVTPFLLDRMGRLTEGRSIAANQALLEHNARVAARLARELSIAR